MDRLIYTALSGMSASMTRERVIASNMANTQTTGFRAETLKTDPVTLIGDGPQVRAMNRASVGGADMKHGTRDQTGQPLDIAMEGDAMLTVQPDDGGEGYTRRGDLSVAATGILQNGDGLPVLGDSGPITVPPGTKVTIAPDGSVLAAVPANPGAAPAVVAKLKLANWRGSDLQKSMDGLFRVPAGGVLPADPDAKVQSGALEGSNVDPTSVLVEMVQAQRLFDMRSKVVSTAKELDEHSATLMRLSNG
jgi:flagellar basal-body rod protein FlgF